MSLANIKNVKFRCNEKYAQYLQKHNGNIRQATLTILPCGDLIHKVKETDSVVGIDLWLYFEPNSNIGIFCEQKIETVAIEIFGNAKFLRNLPKK